MKTEILGVKFDNITMEQALLRVEDFFDGEIHMIFTPNPEIVMLAQEDKELKKALDSADMLLADGIGIVIGSRLLGKNIKERVPGFDFVCNLFKTDKTFYLFGSKPGVAQMAAEKLQAAGTKVVGFQHGYFDDDELIINDINEKNPDVLLVCLGAPKQEKWIYQNRHRLNVSLAIGVGGTLDVISGTVKRAPLIYQRLYLEWLYRAICQPSRLPRLLKLPQFLIKIGLKGRGR